MTAESRTAALKRLIDRRLDEKAALFDTENDLHAITVYVECDRRGWPVRVSLKPDIRMGS